MSIGKVIGNYRISQEIGHGGMGKVFKAIHLSLERVVAIKMIHPKLISNDEMISRFYSEAKIQAKLNHPNIVTVYDFFEFEDNHYIIMEYVEGESVSKIISHQGPFDIEFGTKIFLQILEGISYAHSKNVIHKDIKTSNFILTPKLVKITDFGIAQIIGDTSSTEQSGVIGTPKYMSPEMILGKKVDHSTDIYSLGITYYEFLTGEVPFALSKRTDFEIRKAQIELQPPPPTSLNPKIPKEIENIILKCLEKKTKDRFQSVNEFITSIKELGNIKSLENEIELELENEVPSSTNKDRYIEIKEIDISIPQDNKNENYEISGKLGDTNFAKILSRFHYEKSLGHLVIDSDINLKVYFYEGYVQFVECDDQNLLLGKLLVENKTISLKDQEKAVQFTGESGLKIGEALIKLGKITPHELSNILELQIKLKLLNGFRCLKGKYYFQYADQTEVDTIFRVDPVQVIYEAVDQHYIFDDLDDNNNFDGKIKSKDILEKKVGELNLGSVKEIKLANMIKNEVSVSKIVDESPLDKQDTFKFLKFLDLADLIAIERSKAPKQKVSNDPKTMVLDPLGDKTVVLSEAIINAQIGEELKKI